jgi:hypothetical protein
VQRARELGYGVLINRPLNAVVDDELWRIADATEDASAPDLDEVLGELAALEQEFTQRLGAVLDAVPEANVDSRTLLVWSRRITDRETSSRALWNEFERGVLAAELTRVLRALDAAFGGQRLGAVWHSFRERYVRQLERVVVAARHRAAVATNRNNAPIASALGDCGATDASLAQRVIFALSTLDGVSCVLTGMHTPTYAAEACATLRWPASGDTLARLQSLQ